MSRFLLLGTGACEGIPAPFCNCELCRFTRKNGDKDVRRRFGLLLNDETLIDFGPDTISALRTFGKDDTEIQRILITHAHVDHLAPLDLLWRSSYPEQLPLSLFSGPIPYRMIESAAKSLSPNQVLSLKWHENIPGREIEDNGWKILPVKASHGDPGECAFVYCITMPDGKKVLILSDTGWLPEASFEQLKGVNADAAVIEMSYGIHAPYCNEQRTHLGAAAAIRMLDTLKRQNSLREDALCVTTHISHCSNTRHEELEKYFRQFGIHAGFDGFSAEI